MTMVVAVDRRTGDLVPDEQDHRLEQIREPSLGWFARPQFRGQPGEQHQEEGSEHHLEDHVLRDPEAGLHRIQALEFGERLGDQDLAVERLVEHCDVSHLGMTGAEKLRHVFEGLPAVPPHRLRDFEEVAVLEVVDRVVVGHRVANPATKNGGRALRPDGDAECA